MAWNAGRRSRRRCCTMTNPGRARHLGSWRFLPYEPTLGGSCRGCARAGGPRPSRWKCRHVRRRIDATQVVRPDVTQVLRDGGHRAREPMGAIDEQKAVQAEYVVARRLRQHRHHAADGAVVPVTRTCTVISLLPDAAVNYALNVTHCCYPAPQRRIGRLLIARNPMQDTACCVAGGRHTGLPSRRHAHDLPKSHPCALCRKH